MTIEEKEFAGLIHDYLNNDCKNALNETSLELDGHEVALVDDYYPIVSNKNLTRKEFESLLRNGTIEGMGILKERQGSKSPIVLEDATSVLLRQIDNVSKYVGMAIPTRNFNKIYNVTFPDFEGSVKDTIGKRRGTAAQKYIEKLMADLQFPYKERDAAGEFLRGNFAKAVLSINLSVTAKQVASLPNAAAVLGWDAINRSLIMGKVNYDEIDKYTPYMWYRRQGGVDVELGDIAKKQDWSKKLPGLMNWIQKADLLAVGRLWNASKYYVSKNFQDLKAGSDEYFEKVAGMFNKTVMKTQPNYTLMQRPPILRSDSEITKALTMFATQRMQVFNMGAEAIGNLDYARKAFKDGKISKDKFNKSKVSFATSIGAIVAGSLSIAIINLLNNLLTQRGKRYKDEEDEFTVQSIASEIVYDTLYASSTAYGLPELLDGAKALITQDKRYDIQSPAISTINDVFNTANAAVNAIADGKNIPGATRNFAKSLSTVFGIPLTNAEKYAVSILGVINSDIRRNYELFFNPNTPTSVKEFWGGDSAALKKVHLLNRQIEAENKDLPQYQEMELVKLPLDFKKFTLGKQEYVLGLFERLEYEKQLKQGIESELSEIDLKIDGDNTLKDIQKEINSAINRVEKGLREKYAASKAESDADYLGIISNAADKYEEVANLFTAQEYYELYSIVSKIESDKDRKGETIPGSLKSNRLKALINEGASGADTKKLLTALYNYMW